MRHDDDHRDGTKRWPVTANTTPCTSKLTVFHERLKCSIQARSASKGKRDPSPRNQARIPSLARRAWMGQPTARSLSCQLLDAPRSVCWLALALTTIACHASLAVAAEPTGSSAGVPAAAVKDLSLIVSPQHPCIWPVGMTPFAVVPTASFGRTGRHRDMLIIDEHTGTQWDAPAHFVPPPDSGLPGGNPCAWGSLQSHLHLKFFSDWDVHQTRSRKNHRFLFPSSWPS